MKQHKNNKKKKPKNQIQIILDKGRKTIRTIIKIKKIMTT